MCSATPVRASLRKAGAIGGYLSAPWSCGAKNRMIKPLLWLLLLAGTAATDYLAARWVDATTAPRRAMFSAVHEAVGFAAGFAVFTAYQDITLAIPCILGAYLGSLLAGVRRAD